MSGKAPPTGPRALLGSNPKLAPSNNNTNTSSSNANANGPIINTRIGTAPPTGPRSLTNPNGAGSNGSPRASGSSSTNSNNTSNSSSTSAAGNAVGNAARIRARTQSGGDSTRLNGQYNGNQNGQAHLRRNSGAASSSSKMWEDTAPSAPSAAATQPPTQPKMKFKFLGPIRNQPPEPTSEPPPPPPPANVPPPLPPAAIRNNASTIEPPQQKIKFSLKSTTAPPPPPPPPASPPPLPPPVALRPVPRFQPPGTVNINAPVGIVSGGVSLGSASARGLSGGVGLGIPRAQTQSPFQQTARNNSPSSTPKVVMLGSKPPAQTQTQKPIQIAIPKGPATMEKLVPQPPPPKTQTPPVPVQKPAAPPTLYSLPPLPSWPPPASAYTAGLQSFKVLYDPAVPILATSENTSVVHYKKIIETVKRVLPVEKAQERIRGWTPNSPANGKGKEVLVRIEGEVVEGEGDVVVKDPRTRDPKGGILAKRKPRTEFLEIKYEFDANSPGPEPPRCVLLLHISPLTPSANIRRHLSTHGTVQSVEPQIDRENGAPLGIVFVRFSSHEEAMRCVTKEDGAKASLFGGMNASVKDEGRVRAVLDGQGVLLKAVMKEIDDRKKKGKKEKEKEKESSSKDKEKSVPKTPASAATPNPTLPIPPRPPVPVVNGRHGASAMASQMSRPASVTRAPIQPISSTTQPNRPSMSSPISTLPFSAAAINGISINGPLTSSSPNPINDLQESLNNMNKKLGLPANPMTARVRRPPPSSSVGGMSNRPGRAIPMNINNINNSSSSASGSRYAASVRDEDRHWDPSIDRSRRKSRSRSRERERRGQRGRVRGNYASSSYVPARDYRDRSRSRERERERDRRHVPVVDDAETKKRNKELQLELVKELARNGKDHVRIDGNGAQLLGGVVQEEDVLDFFKGFKIDKVLKDHIGWYVTFQTSDTARRAAMVLNSGERKLAYRSVTISVHPAPAMPDPVAVVTTKVDWTDEELVDQAGKLILRELGTLLEKDIKERVVVTRLRGVIADVVRKKEKSSVGSSNKGEDAEKKGLKGLSFKRRKKERVVVPVPVEEDSEPEPEPEPEVEPEEEESEEERVLVERPKKRRKKEPVRKKVRPRLEVESEDEDPPPLKSSLKRHVSSEPEDEPDRQPARKKHKVETKAKKQKQKLQSPEQEDEDISVQVVVVPDEFDAPEVAQVRLTPTPGFESSLSPSRSPSPEPGSPKRPRLPTPPPEPPEEDVCADDEDLYFARLALSGTDPSNLEQTQTSSQDRLSAIEQFELELGLGHDVPPSLPSAAPFRVHVTGSARTEGYYKITHAEKMAYVTQYQARASLSASKETRPVEPEAPAQHVTSSRSNRANARRLAQGMEEINQVQHAIALSIGAVASSSDLSTKFNQLQTRKKHLRFARSPIHDWGLYALEKISKGEMVIEYVGEVIRAQVADKREKAYERQGIGSSYLFRIDEDLVVDATKKGNLGRLINHSCDPNCTAKIITINGEKKIVIYAKMDIELGDEITYDYHFPIEQDKIRCLCGSEKCRGFLN